MKIFIIHGWTYTTENWKTVIKELQKSGHKVEMLNVPGLTEKSDEVWTLDSYVEWLRDKIGKEKKPVVVGHSNGGRISIAYCRKYPNHIKHLFLLDSAGIRDDRALVRAKRRTYHVIAKTGKKVTSSPKLKKVMYKVAGVSDYNKAPKNMQETMKNMLEADKKLNPSFVTVPTTIIWGDKDKTTPLRDGKKLKNEIIGSTFHVIKGAGHSPHITNPDELVKIIRLSLSGSK